jgi:hypothetical protein
MLGQQQLVIKQLFNIVNNLDGREAEYQDLYSHLTSILREVQDKSEIPIQNLIDDVYSLMVSPILNNSQKSTKSQQNTSENGNVRRTMQCYMYGPTPSGRPNTKTARDPSRGQILNHKDHNLEKLWAQRQLQLINKNGS